jgi:hypothetical protein
MFAIFIGDYVQFTKNVGDIQNLKAFYGKKNVFVLPSN